MTYRDHVISEIVFYNLPEELLLERVHSFLEHGGKILEAESCSFQFIFIISSIGRVDWIPDLLFSASEPWLVDDFSSLQICYIGALAHVDAVFCDRLKKELASCYSPPSLHRTHSADHLFETVFGPASIESHFQTLNSFDMDRFLSCLCRTGSVALIKLFIDLGVDVNGGNFYGDMLGIAAAAGNVDIVNMLLEAGANGSLAIAVFLAESTNLPDTLFRSLLELLVENARPASFQINEDPLVALIASSRALRSYPKALETLLNRNIFTNECFGEPASGTWYYDSYMYQAISRGHSSVVDLLLRNGACADARISHSFYCEGKWLEICTWVTFAVMCGEASCTDVLIQHGADVTALDGAGKSAIQLAKQNAVASHPRTISNYSVYIRDDITAEEDAETLVVVERAFNLKFRGTMSIEDYLNSSAEITPQPPSRRDKFTSMLQNTLKKALRTFLTPSQTELLLDYLKPLYRKTRRIWSLPFHEALLMRSIYVLSYAILLAYELHAFIKGRKRIPMPSRFFLSALALLALAVIWVSSSQGGFGWGLFYATGKESKMESGY